MSRDDQEMNIITNKTIKCLDKGYITLLDCMPGTVPLGKTCEHRIAQSARTSFDNYDKETSITSDSALVRYLYENSHTSPLEMVEFMFEIYCPQFVATHLHRHRTANINEQSQRYIEVGNDMYCPSNDVRKQSKSNKQGSVTDQNFHNSMESTMKEMEELISNHVMPKYHDMINKNVAKEIARAYLPRACYTKMVYKMDANNLLKFLGLRCANDAQKETRVYATAMKELVKPLIPTLITCLDERSNSIYLSPVEVKSLSTGKFDPSISSSVRRKEIMIEKFNRIRRRRLYVLVGYKRTGKDTLAQALMNGSDSSNTVTSLYPLALFKLPECVNGKRIALADAVKDEVFDLHDNLDLLDPDLKDTKCLALGNRTPRELWIEHAMLKRQSDPNYWLNVALEKINDDHEHDIIVTDCRFPNELEAFKRLENFEVITIRIFRSSVPLPNDDDISEHSMDNVRTDYLLTDNHSSLDQAIKLFPQYTTNGFV